MGEKRYGRYVQVEFKFREATMGSNYWGPWKSIKFPDDFNGSGITQAIAVRSLINRVVGMNWVKNSDLFVYSGKKLGLFDFLFTDLQKTPLDSDVDGKV